MRPAKTLAEHRQYLDDIVGLKLHFLHRWVTEHPEEDFVFVLRDRVDIYRKTDANPGPLVPADIDWDAPTWKRYEEALRGLFERHRGDREAFEREGLALLKDTLDARAPRDFADPTVLAPYDCGSLRHEPNQDVPGERAFHIANALSPGSIFDDPAYLPACFLVLIDQVQFRWGDHTLKTKTWLNDNPRWLELFPTVWHENLTDRLTSPRWNYGWWGQFLTARGTFHHAAGEQLRRTGKMPFYPRASKAPIDVLKEHFRGLLRN